MSSAKDQAKQRCKDLRREIEKLRRDRKKEGIGPDETGALAYASGKGAERTEVLARTERRILTGHYGKIYAMHFHSNANAKAQTDTLVSAAQDGKLMIWNANTKQKRLAIPMKSSWVMTCAISPSGGLVSCGGLDNVCSVYKVTGSDSGFVDKPPYQELAKHEGYLSCCRFQDEEHIITASGDSTLLRWDVETRQERETFDDHTGDVMSVAINTDNPRLFVSGSCDATAKLWDVRAPQRAVMSFDGHESDINTVAWFPDFEAFGTGSDDATMRMFDKRSYGELQMFDSSKLYCGVMSIDFSRSGKYLFAGYDDNPYCLVWDVNAPQDYVQVLPHKNRVSCLGVNQDGSALCTGCWDFSLRVWA